MKSPHRLLAVLMLLVLGLQGVAFAYDVANASGDATHAHCANQDGPSPHSCCDSSAPGGCSVHCTSIVAIPSTGYTVERAPLDGHESLQVALLSERDDSPPTRPPIR